MTSTASSQRVKIRQGDKLKALELLGKHLGMFVGETQSKTDPENELEGLGDDELEREIARLKKQHLLALKEKLHRAEGRKIAHYFPETGKLARQNYPCHMAFFKAGARHRERCFYGCQSGW